MLARKLAYVDTTVMDVVGDSEQGTTPLAAPPAGQLPNLVTSELADGRHAVTLDIDHQVTVVPSSTPGHFHLYIDVPMDWDTYTELLMVMAKAGIIGPGYVDHSVNRGATALRMPWINKDTAPPLMFGEGEPVLFESITDADLAGSTGLEIPF